MDARKGRFSAKKCRKLPKVTRPRDSVMKRGSLLLLFFVTKHPFRLGTAHAP
jgi:hypothetical protein